MANQRRTARIFHRLDGCSTDATRDGVTNVARIAGVNIPTQKRVVISLQYIHGIGAKFAKDICTNLQWICRCFSVLNSRHFVQPAVSTAGMQEKNRIAPLYPGFGVAHSIPSIRNCSIECESKSCMFGCGMCSAGKYFILSIRTTR